MSSEQRKLGKRKKRRERRERKREKESSRSSFLSVHDVVHQLERFRWEVGWRHSKEAQRRGIQIVCGNNHVLLRGIHACPGWGAERTLEHWSIAHPHLLLLKRRRGTESERGTASHPRGYCVWAAGNGSEGRHCRHRSRDNDGPWGWSRQGRGHKGHGGLFTFETFAKNGNKINVLQIKLRKRWEGRGVAPQTFILRGGSHRRRWRFFQDRGEGAIGSGRGGFHALLGIRGKGGFSHFALAPLTCTASLLIVLLELLTAALFGPFELLQDLETTALLAPLFHLAVDHDHGQWSVERTNTIALMVHSSLGQKCASFDLY